MNKKTLVILAGLLSLTAMVLMSCAAPTPQIVPQTVVVPQTVAVPQTVIAPQTVVVQPPAPTVAPTKPAPTAAPVPPVAVLKVVPVPGVVTDKNAITATIKIVTDTVVGPANATIAMATTGGSNVPINVPVHVAVAAQDAKNAGKPTWTLTKPADSKSALKDAAAMETEFTPDVVGAYYVQVTLKNDAGLTSAPQFAFFNAGTYIGVYTGNCKQCHAEKTAEWAKTGHAIVFPEELDNKIDGPRGIQPSAAGYITHYSETCVACHATGYYAAPYNGAGGYFDAKAKANWTFPTWKQIDEVFTKKAPSNYDAAPQGIKDMGTIGCEQCHGPASEHVKKGAKVMNVSWDNGVCNQCHGTRGGHTRGVQITFSKHTTGTSFEEIKGPARQACMRCHGAEGFVSFIANPKNPAAWKNEEGSVGCATCHDPHSEANPFQLRVVGKPLEVPFTGAKDVGLSGICETCHNNRGVPEDAVKGSYPHYASDAEQLSDTGGVAYGQTVPNSPHGLMVGAAPVPNPAYDPKNAESAKFLFSPIGDNKGNTPGPCVVCHMWAAVTSPLTDTFAMKVGGHSFNTVTPDGKSDYGASCKSCHGEVKDFNLKAKADYDGNGKVEGVQDEMKGLLNVLWKGLEAKGFKKQDSGYPYATIPADASNNAKNAWYNFRYVYGVMWGAAGPGGEGKAAAVHNFKRSCALLQLSLKDLTGALPTGATDCTK